MLTSCVSRMKLLIFALDETIPFPGSWEQCVHTLHTLHTQVLEQHEVEMSLKRPDSRGPLPTTPSTANIGQHYSFLREEHPDRPSTAPDAVARVLQASIRERMTRVCSVHQAERWERIEWRAWEETSKSKGSVEILKQGSLFSISTIVLLHNAGKPAGASQRERWAPHPLPQEHHLRQKQHLLRLKTMRERRRRRRRRRKRRRNGRRRKKRKAR